MTAGDEVHECGDGAELKANQTKLTSSILKQLKKAASTLTRIVKTGFSDSAFTRMHVEDSDCYFS